MVARDESTDGIAEAYDNWVFLTIGLLVSAIIVPAPYFRTRPKRFNSRRSPRANAEWRANGTGRGAGPFVFTSTMGGGAAAAAYFISGRLNAARQPTQFVPQTPWLSCLTYCLTRAEFAAQDRLADLSDAASGPERRSEIEASHLNRSTAVAPPDVQMPPLAGAKLRAAKRGDLP
jgi:hypothetical protein